jgi:fructuronate reductase/mannitol 2-dehydrogenase
MDWGIVGVGLRSGRMRAALAPQDCLYTVLERGPGGERARVVGAMRGCLVGPRNPETVLRVLSRPDTRLVTVTVTGGGYHIDAATGELDWGAAPIEHDLRHPRSPVSLPGYLAEALDRRRRHGTAPFTVLSCDNVPRNGAVVKQAVTELAARRDPALGRWIEAQVSFPHSMVDRITPRTTIDVRRALAADHGVDDRWPVLTEPFSQWVVEDDFSNERPPLEQVGVEFVADVAPFELAKKRLLNGTHCALAYLGLLAGHATTAQAMADPRLRDLTTRLMDEVVQLLPPSPGLDAIDYARTIRERLANRGMADQLTRLAARGSTKMPAYLLPSLAQARRENRPCGLLATAVAAWLLCLRDPEAHGIEDEHLNRLRVLAADGGDDPRSLLRERWLFGELSADEGLADLVAASMLALQAQQHEPTPTRSTVAA